MKTNANNQNADLFQLFIFRHGEKEFIMSNDPALTERGRNQADNLAKTVRSELMPIPKKLLSSPRRRAIETFTPLSNSLKVELEVTENLNERKHTEVSSQFDERMKKLSSNLTQNTINHSVVYAVTHSDVIEKILLFAPYKDTHSEPPRHLISLGTCHFVQFEIEKDGSWIYKNHGGGFQ